MEERELRVECGNDAAVLPVVELTGARAGPHGFVSAGMHGNEINGIAIARRFLDWADESDLESRLAGRLTVFPLLNPSGFARMHRRVIEDDRDLNRSFGIDAPTSLAGEIARAVTDRIAPHCAFGVDLHDAGWRSVLVPHCRVHTDAELSPTSTRELAQLFGTKLVVERPGHEHMLAVAFKERFRIPVLTVEIGGGQQLYTQFFDEALAGLRNVLAAYKMIEEPVRPPPRQFLLNDRYGVKTTDPCQVHFDIELGDNVHAGDVIGSIYYPQRGETEPVQATMCGYVFSLWARDQAPRNVTIYSILEEDECCVARTTLDQFEALPPLPSVAIKM